MSWRYLGTTRNSPPADLGESIAPVVRGYVVRGGKMIPAVLYRPGREVFFLGEDGGVVSALEAEFKFNPVFRNAELEAQLEKMGKLFSVKEAQK